MLDLLQPSFKQIAKIVRDWRHPRGFNPYYLPLIGQPRTVIDVGVGHGTPQLYSAFPEADLILVEPLRDYAPALQPLLDRRNARIHYCAASNREGTEEILVDTRNLTRTSFSARTRLTRTGNPLEPRTVEVTTLDKILESHPDIAAPVLLKIDTEGHELEVVEGADALLEITDVVIAEVSVAQRFENSYVFEDMIRAMQERGFALFDFLRLSYIKGEAGTKFVDAVFKKKPVTQA